MNSHCLLLFSFFPGFCQYVLVQVRILAGLVLITRNSRSGKMIFPLPLIVSAFETPFSLGHFRKWISLSRLKDLYCISRLSLVRLIYLFSYETFYSLEASYMTQSKFQVDPESSPLVKSDPVQKKRSAQIPSESS